MSASAGAKAPSTQAAPTQDRTERRAERHELELNVDFESDSTFYTGLTQNISTGGIFLATHQPKKVGDHVRVRFSLPGSDHMIVVDTEVRWLRHSSSLHRSDGPPGMGLRFLALPADDAERIQQFVNHRDSLFYDDELIK